MIVTFTLIGQATIVINIDNCAFMTDPWWGSFEFLRAVPLIVNPELIEPVHYMLVSHNHVDHWCKRAITMAREKDITVVGSVNAVKRAKKNGVTKAFALTPGESFQCDKCIVTAVPAFHPFAKDAIGFIIQKDNVVLYFSGDTLYTKELYQALTPYTITIAMIQVACSSYPLVGKDGMDLEAAARFVHDVKPIKVIPIHYQIKGKYVTDEILQSWQVEAEKVILPHGKEYRMYI